jgi:sodium-dependent dicarboxylate transporter 2/3/5
MADSLVKKKKSTSYYIHSAIALSIMVFGRFIPVSYPFTPNGMLVLAVLIGAIYMYIQGELFWPSIAALLLLGTSDVASVNGLFVQLFTNSSFMFLAVLFLFVAYLSEVGFAQTLALKILSAKFSKGRPWTLTFLLLVATFLPATFMSVSATLIMLLPLLYSICDEVGMSRTSKWAVLMGLGMGSACSFALFFWPFTVGMVALGGVIDAAGFAGGIPFAQVVASNAILVGLCLVALWGIIRILKPDVTALYNYTPPAEKVKFNSEQRFALGLVFSLLGLLIIPQFLPDGALRSFLGQFGTVAIVFFLLSVGDFIRKKEGKPHVDIAAAAKGGLDRWALLVMIGTVLVITGILTGPDAGFVDLIVLHLSPVFGAVSPVVFSVVVLFAAFILTIFLTGPNVYAIMIPVVVPTAMALGFNVWQILAPFLLVANIGIVTPPGHPLGAILHAHESIGGKMTVKYMPLYMTVFFIIALGVGIPLSRLIF